MQNATLLLLMAQARERDLLEEAQRNRKRRLTLRARPGRRLERRKLDEHIDTVGQGQRSVGPSPVRLRG